MITKKDIYAKYGIKYDTKSGKIYCDPLQSWIKPVCKHGNSKIGKVWQFSTLAANVIVSESVARAITGKDDMETRTLCGGTCGMMCKDKDGKCACYGCLGHYTRSSVQICNGRHSYLSRVALDWLRNAIIAQIEADHIELFRIHVTGDMVNREYAGMWLEIIRKYPGVTFWTYTKQRGKGFDDVLDAIDSEANANIVKSIVPGVGYNFGHAGYLIGLYDMLTRQGKSVYICRCGVDNSQHCDDCSGCRNHEFVLFLEHGTDYNPKNDPAYPAFVDLVNSQKKAAA